MRRLVLANILVALLGAQAALAGSSWGGKPTTTASHFYQAWQTHQTCGQPTSREWRNTEGWHQRFEHCRMDEAPVVVHAYASKVTPAPTPPPLATHTPTPTATTIPTATATPAPTWTPAPTPTAISATGITLQLALINQERASHGYAPLTLDPVESAGTGTCIGAQGHANSMAAAGTIGHWDFPADLCDSYFTGGENVGMSGGSIDQAIQAITAQMLAEPWSPGCTGNHHCSIDNPAFTRVGIGIAQVDGWVFISQDFEG